jgi:hypothetical protein
MTTIINVEVEKITPSKIDGGTVGSYGFHKLSFRFSAEWKGLGKRIVFDIPRSAAVVLAITDDTAEYDIPAEVKAYAGEIPFTIEGYYEDNAIYTVSGVVMVTSSAAKPTRHPPTPSEVQQIYTYLSQAQRLYEFAFNPKGKYSDEEAYNYLDVIEYNNDIYIVKKFVKGVEPADGEYYMLAMKHGESAYEIAIRLGTFEGTEEEWNNYIAVERDKAIDAIVKKGAETLASIPDNYETALREFGLQTLYNRIDETVQISIDDFIEFGIHKYNASTVPIGCPIETGGGLVLVFQHDKKNDPTKGFLVQMVLAQNGNAIRYKTTNKWLPWYRFALPVETALGDSDKNPISQKAVNDALAQTFYSRIDVRATTDSEGNSIPKSMDDLVEFGIHRLMNASDVKDCPVAFPAIALVLRYSKTNDITSGYMVQIAISSGKAKYRFRTMTTWQPWRTLYDRDDTVGISLTPEQRKSNRTVDKVKQKFTPSKTIRSSASEGETTYFYEGTEYTGVPYSSVHMYEHDVFYNHNLNTLFSAFKNPDSLMYNYANEHHNKQTYIGGVCSSFVSWFINHPVYITTTDMERMMIDKHINDLEDLEVGDILLYTGHCAAVSGLVDKSDGSIEVAVSEMWRPLFRTAVYTAEEFREYVDSYDIRIGRLPDQTGVRTIAPPVIVDDCITERGDDTFFAYGEDVYMMINGNNFSVKAPSSATFVAANKTSLPQKVGSITQYNIKSLLTETGVYEFKSGASNGKVSRLAVYKPGTVALANDKVTISGYEGCTPYSYRVIRLTDTPDPNGFAAPEGYGAMNVPYDQNATIPYFDLITADTFNIDSHLIAKNSPGYYVRVLYDTGCGKAYKDSPVQWFS